MAKKRQSKKEKSGKPLYVPRPNSKRLSARRAQYYGEELAKLEQTRGGLTAAKLVEHAAHPSSVFHGEFEWDDTKAGHRYRLEQASHLIRQIHVTLRVIGSRKPVKISPTIKTIRAFHSVRMPTGHHTYVPVDAVQQHDEYRQQLIQQCLVEGRRWAEKARRFKELDALVIVTLDAIDEVEQELNGDKKRKTNPRDTSGRRVHRNKKRKAG